MSSDRQSYSEHFQFPFSRRAFFLGTAATGLALTNEIVAKPAATVFEQTVGIQLSSCLKSVQAHAATPAFEWFDANSPNARPSFLNIRYDWHCPGPDRVNGGASTSWCVTSGGCDSINEDIFMQGGRSYIVVGMDVEHTPWFSADWDDVGTYYGRRVGARMRVSEPVHTNLYNDWGYANGWHGDELYKRYGARHFFVLAQTFSSSLAHWICGLAKVRQTFEFYYTDDVVDVDHIQMIDLDQAYFTCRSVQADCGGNEWASPGQNWLGHAFVPPGGMSTAHWTNRVFPGWDVVATTSSVVDDSTAFSFDYRGRSIDFYRGDSVGWDGFNWSFDTISGFGKLRLHKSSSNPAISNASSAYSLRGAQYNVYSDAACTRYVGMFTTNDAGDAALAAWNGTQYLPSEHEYWIKEVTPSPGFLLDSKVYSVWLERDADKTVYVTEIPKSCTIIYISDNSEVLRETYPIGVTFTPSQAGTRAGTKPNCTPGFIAWYNEANLSTKFTSMTTYYGEKELYGRNKCTLQFEVSSQSDAEESGQPYYLRPADSLSSATRYAWPNLSDRQCWWGDRIMLPPLKLIFEPSDDPTTDVPYWRTLRQKSWSSYDDMRSPIVNSVAVDSDETFYCWWKYATQDGVTDNRS